MKKNIYIAVFIAILYLFSNSANSQVIQFSQYYSSPTILGPSFAGLHYETKAVMNYRNQWPGISNSFVTSAFTVDHFFENRNSGVGLSVLRDEAGAGNLSLTDFGVSYSYNLKATRNISVRPGIGFKYSKRGIDFYELTFADQLKNINNPAETTTEVEPEEGIGYFDAVASFLVFSKNYWGGVTVDHLFKPNQSFFDDEAKVDMLIQAYGGYKIYLKDPRHGSKRKNESLTFSFLYKMQGKFKQLDLGAYWQKNDLLTGLWYRGIPVLNNPEQGYRNNDAVILMLGYNFYSLSLQYSYDITVNSLMKSSAGSHEIALIYNFKLGKRSKFKKYTPIPCPGF